MLLLCQIPRVPHHRANLNLGKVHQTCVAVLSSVSEHQHHHHRTSTLYLSIVAQLPNHQLVSGFLVEKVNFFRLKLLVYLQRQILAVVKYAESTTDEGDDLDSQRVMKAKERAIETVDVADQDADGASAIDVGNESHDAALEWQEYNATEFGPDIVPDSSGANNIGPSMADLSAADVATEVASESVTVTTGEPDMVLSYLLSLSSQRSFSNLNIDPNDNPYSANVDFGFDF